MEGLSMSLSRSKQIKALTKTCLNITNSHGAFKELYLFQW